MAYTTTESRDGSDFTCIWNQKLLEFHQDLVLLSLHPISSAPLSSVWASLSCKLSQYGDPWQLHGYILTASRPRALGTTFPPLRQL